ncbi:MAG: HAD hydrolase family protein [Oscillospiraceae bacterium]|nr:HAD hydrolase family protein [Oscillospiraceae bacterium]
MRTLYVSDLDGTLLRSSERTSEYTNSVINRLTAQGMLFSYATARSFHTAKKVTAGMTAKIPLIVYNGAFIIDNVTGDRMLEQYFDTGVQSLLTDLFVHEIYPIVYADIGGQEKFSFIPALCTPGMRRFLNSRNGDVRTRAVNSTQALCAGRIFYITCIDEPEKLLPLYEKYRSIFRCVYQIDIYSGAQWLEMMPQAATKANAIRQLKALLGCDRLIVFGDGQNDIDMFQTADESYAVENADDALKAYASGVIASNDADGIAHWLEQHVQDTESPGNRQ